MTSKRHYPDADPNPDFPKIEETTLAHWKANNLFARSVEKNPGNKPRSSSEAVAQSNTENNEFIFYDGPPFANGLPHYGHLLTGYVKDLFARYHTMKGERVERRFGWDCHGLPAEMGAEKELGISGRQAIADYGIGKFNEHCRTSVMKYTREWEDYVTRQARWVDFAGDYKTMDKNFMESVLWAFSELYKKGLIYEAYRVMAYSWAAETPLSNFETKLDNSYREREDKAITVTFELKEKPKGAPEAENYYVLAWTTTPWTLPSNLALAVGKDVEYVAVEVDSDCYLIGKNALSKYEKDLSSRTSEARSGIQSDGEMDSRLRGNDIKGDDLLGLTYEPLFPYFENATNAFRILDGSDFVTDEDGTGIVHMAPGFGEDDQRVCEKNGIELVVPVDGRGRYTDEIYDLQNPPLTLKGLNVIAQTEGQCGDEPYKPEQLAKYGLANLRIISWLKETGKLIKQEDFKHNYPHCWRTDTPLIYRALPSWYVEVTKFRDRAVELNKQINWVPSHVRDGQMGHMLATAPDWSISRNRFWGTPIPVWRGDKGNLKVFGSITELEEFFGVEVKDLHRPYIDELVKTDENGETFKRVEDVFDCWFESGSMPFAQVHYPFENKEWFDGHFPADFITEYVGQTRGWFNTLIMLSTALFDKPPFQNCICHGVVLDSETGLKYSKRLKNYKDPKEVMDVYGADALRWLMMASPVMRGADIAVDPDGKFIRDAVRLYIKPIWNAYSFFTMYANADGIKAEFSTDSTNLMDRYILAKCKLAVEQIEKALDAYETPPACAAVTDFFEALNNWYIRRSKERFWKKEKDNDKLAAYNTLYTVLHLMSRASAPLLPLTLDHIFRNISFEESVHLADFPDVSALPKDMELERGMDWARDVCNTALAVRNKINIRVRQPLRDLRIVSSRPAHADFYDIIEEEVNVKEVKYGNHIDGVADYKLALNNKVLGKRLPEKMKQIIPASKKGEWKLLDDGGVEILGEKLEPEEFTLNLEPKPEYADQAQALSTNDALVILDTEITPELEREGLARDLIRLIQQARKDAGFDISDHIALALGVSEKVAAAVQENEERIKSQTLTVALSYADQPAGSYVTESEIEDQKVAIAVSKAA